MEKPRLYAGAVLLFPLAACAGAPARAPTRDAFPLSTRWTVSTSDVIEGPLASDGGRIFVATRDGRVAGLDRFTGTTVWEVQGRKGALAFDAGVLALREPDGTVWSMDPATGSALWKVESGITGTLPPAIMKERVFVGGEGLAALDARTGAVQWTAADARPAVTPVVGQYCVVVGDARGNVECRDFASGLLTWSHPLEKPLAAAPVVDTDGNVLFGTQVRSFMALDGRSGKEEWAWRLGANVQTPPALFEDMVVFATNEDILYALRRGNGHMAWRAPLPSRPLARPVLFGGVALVACHGARPAETVLIGFDGRTGERQGDLKAAGEVRAPPLLVEDRLYLAMRERAGVIVSLQLGSLEVQR